MARNYHVFDLIILGGGPAGRAALAEALKFTPNVALVSPRKGSFTQGAYESCLCDYLAEQAQNHAGVVDWPALRAKKQELKHSAAEGFRPYMHYCIKGVGKFASPSTLRVDGRLLHFSSAIVAIGAADAVPQKWPAAPEQGKAMAFKAHTHAQCSFGAALAAWGVRVEMEIPKTRFGISKESVAKWQKKLPPTCGVNISLSAEKTLFPAMPSGIGLRAAGISKAAWLGRNASVFRVGDSHIFAAGSVRGSAKDAFACAEEGRHAVWEALGQPVAGADAATAAEHFTLYGGLKLAVFGASLQTVVKNSAQAVEHRLFRSREGEGLVWLDKATGAPLRAEMLAEEPAAMLAFMHEWMRTATMPDAFAWK